MNSKTGSKMQGTISLVPLFLAMFLSACAQQTGVTARSEVILYPSLPQQPRIQYLTAITSEESLDPTAAQGGFREFIVGADTTRKVRQLERPFSLGQSKGFLYVLDRKFKAVTRINLVTGKFDYLDDVRGGRPIDPLSIFVDVDGRVYMADPARKDIMVYNPRGEFETSYATGEESRPVDVVVKEDKLYVIDTNGMEILIIDKVTGELLGSFGGPGLDDGLLNKPSHLALTSDGRVAVTDTLNYRVQLFDAEGNYLDKYGELGQGRGAVVRPKGISIDSADNLYLADVAFQMITIFDLETGTPRMTFGKVNQPGGTYLPQDVLIDRDNVDLFRQYAHPNLDLEYVIYVANGYKAVNVYGFGNWTGSLDPDAVREVKGNSQQSSDSGISSLEEIVDQGDPEP